MTLAEQNFERSIYFLASACNRISVIPRANLNVYHFGDKSWLLVAKRKRIAYNKDGEIVKEN